MPESPLIPTTTAIPMLVESVLKEKAGRLPVVTVSWAQSKDGALAPQSGARTTLSGPEAMQLTHRLRSLHRGILVGIGTVLTDDPRLTVRLVDGISPQPIVLDSRLRMPDSARLLSVRDRAPWIFHDRDASRSRARELAGRGARLFAVEGAEGALALGDVLATLGNRGIFSLMVEGGARVLRSFLAAGLAHQAVITISPVEMEGVCIFDAGERAGMLAFTEKSQERYGRDTVTWGRF